MSATLFSIGYATKPLTEFMVQLQSYEVNVVADVRSVPYSAAFHDYHRELLQRALKQQGISYVYLGKELGPRSTNPAHYDETGRVQYDRLQRADNFLHGIERLLTGLDKALNIALLCAEKDPAFCHRSLLIGHHLARANALPIQHIGFDGALESQAELEQRLVSLHDLEQDLFAAADDLAELAYKRQVQATSYRKSSDS
ncbi:MAG TPA: DUF488 domain-containing protein [Gammaproteobacteria bacterium]|jgi:uncharacterized protein (DUF488 family)|uniref:DUF488 domain-containing protein n=1 Tax=OM182 bacterium TaxID=2510334 RepID=A0A520S3G7_9GAMM|nr:hypothetical protein [Gammaproteobacteria bacterium]RPG45886.1 MAG: DUF488 domain-containing protein [Gammaproteobacteria bacterium TMED163]RZO77017.1 MAG: DUF488 domain-containing protein [OM182 bacterium]RPG46387.1 MAG: DUF488 domain-containing protein [Gammaproteobacteria bacterium TMED163]HAO89541.1 DUF488 domain-containing protein [Gammaproteobacteria bacterium]|tara:strand:+ start:59 stop:655 length:597 start_codon:yes stop_codon:yes gene_type:complete